MAVTRSKGNHVQGRNIKISKPKPTRPPTVSSRSRFIAKQWDLRKPRHGPWEKLQRKNLTLPERMNTNSNAIQEYDRVCRYQYGKITVERFLDISLGVLSNKPRLIRKPADANEYADQMLEAAETYQRVPAGYTYIAVDLEHQRLLAVFPHGLMDVYGGNEGMTLARDMKSNIEKYLKVKSPSKPSNGRHSSLQQWMKDRPHLQHCGVFQWGLWEEQGHRHMGPAMSKDVMVNARAL
ncbi:MAG: hypothetical protein M1816_004962 [Peltula sp. TS41687]|nr:MAG: hypothetical protein M1816_004962 [Peltula sp. TS41687]